MKLGIEWNSKDTISIEEQAALIRENGFDATMVGLEEERLGEIMTALRRHDIACEHYHAPFNGINSMWEAGDAGERMLERLCDCVRAGATYGVPVVVVHLSSGMTPPRMNDIGFERYDRLMQLAEREGVTIAYENIRRLDNVVYMLENYPKAGFCWDVGHEACYMNGVELMPLFGKRMAALHLHDNTAVYDEDKHWLPFTGVVDMERAARHFANSPYRGSVMLEVRKNNVGEECSRRFYEMAYAAAKRFADLADAFRADQKETK